MGSRHGRPGRRGPARLAIERLEGRDLPTAATLLAGPIGLRPTIDARSIAAADLTPGGVPTPHEVARQRFHAMFSGSFTTGPGRYTSQALQVNIRGGGTSNAFLKGTLQLGAYTPADGSGVVTGDAVLYPNNAASSGSVLVLNLQGDASSLDRFGRPTRMTWTIDVSSGGLFSNSTGEGTLEIRYGPASRKLPSRALSAGSAGVIFRGRVETTGVADLLVR